MKKLLILLIGMLIGVGGCGQPNQIKQGYEIKQTVHGYTVSMPRQRYTFKDDMKIIWQDEEFRTHIIFWSSVCGYPFFGMPFTEITPIILS